MHWMQTYLFLVWRDEEQEIGRQKTLKCCIELKNYVQANINNNIQYWFNQGLDFINTNTWKIYQSKVKKIIHH